MKAKNVRLVVSKQMDAGGAKEQSVIRIPKRARLYFDSKGDRLVISAGKNTKVLDVRPAYRSDIMDLRKSLDSGEISDKDVQSTGFVSTTTFKEITRSVGQKDLYSKCFLTDGVEQIKIGGDPEFALIDPKTLRFKYAQQVHSLSINDQLGHDGPLAELRPPPESTPGDLVDGILKILKRDQKKIDSYLWLGGAAYRPPDWKEDERIVQIGGHIQFGNPALLPAGQINSIYKQIVRVLDELVALPMVRIDTPMPEHRRNSAWQGYGKYGRWSDYKAKENRFEWRVPSGLWLVHPDMARAVLGVSKAVVEASYQLMAENNFDDSWICARSDRKGFLKKFGVLGAKQVEKLINDANPSAIDSSMVTRAAKKLRGLSNYPEYSDDIEEFIRLVRLSESDRSKINLDLKSTWLNKGKLITGGK